MRDYKIKRAMQRRTTIGIFIDITEQMEQSRQIEMETQRQVAKSIKIMAGNAGHYFYACRQPLTEPSATPPTINLDKQR